MDNPNYQRPHLYQSANDDDEKIKENFLIRLNEYDIIIKDILNHPMKGSVQHYLLIGRRGSGKSTLLKRIQIEISSNPVLKDKYIPVNLAEEQANIYKLYDLLEEIVHELEHHCIRGIMPEWEDDAHNYTRKLFDYLNELIHQSGKKIILLLDNIDRIFENIEDEASLLREYLLNHHNIRIIGGSTRMTEHFWKYNQPFYQFFRVLELKALSSEEVKLLLLNWSERMNLPELKTFVETRPGQLETIRLLTDGLPRTLQFFVNILLTNSQDTGYEYLRHVMDSVTPLYQERLNALPPSQRKIVLQLAFIWESIGTGKLAEIAKMNNNVISAQLKQLSEKGIVEKVESGNKNHLYRITERFFNLWLIFTQGSPREKRKAKYLTVFLENFYDAEQLKKLAVEHIVALNQGAMPPGKAALLTKALAQSKYIEALIRETLIIKTLNLDNISDEIRNQLPPTVVDRVSAIIPLIREGSFEQVLRMAGGLDEGDGFKEFIQGCIYTAQKQLDKAISVLNRSLDKGFVFSIYLLASDYFDDKNYSLAEQYYLKGVDVLQGIPHVRVGLGKTYLRMEKYELAKEQFLLSIADDKIWSVEIGKAYIEMVNLDEAVFFFKVGVDANVSGAATNLALTFYARNINKEEALELIEMDRNGAFGSSEYFRFTEIIVNVWGGNLLNIKERVLDLLKDGTDDIGGAVLTKLLELGQFNMVYQLFESSEIAASLRERFAPIYYATIILSEPQEKAILKIPPEIKVTVEQIIGETRKVKHYFEGNP